MKLFLKLGWLIFTALVFTACQTTPKDIRIIKTAKIKSVYHFDEGRAVAITQEKDGDQGGIGVGKRYAIGLQVRLKFDVASSIEDGDPLPEDSHMYLDIYDLASKTLKPKRIDLFQATEAHQPGFLPDYSNSDVVIIDGVEYFSVFTIKKELDTEGDVVTDAFLINLATGEPVSYDEVQGTRLEEASPTDLYLYTNFDKRIAKYGFKLYDDNQLPYDMESGIANTKLNLIQENPKLKKMLYDEGGAVYLLQREEATKEELTDLFLHWFSTPQKPMELTLKRGDFKAFQVSSYQEIQDAYEDMSKSSPSSTPSER